MAQQSSTTFIGLPNSGIAIQQTGPVSATITNGTAKAVLAFSLQWIWLNPDGSTQSTHNVTYIKPGEKLNPELPPSFSRSISVTDFASLKQEYARVSGARVLLDAVVFDDDTVVGPDRTSTTAVMQARAKARQDVLGLIVARPDIRSPEEIERLVNENPPNAVSNARAASTMTAKAAWQYKFVYQTWSKSLIRIAQIQGVVGLREYVTNLRARYQGTNYHQKPL